MDLFDSDFQQIVEKEQPLAARMRPRSLDEYIGQDHILGKGRLLYRAIQGDQLSSLIFYGPPGTGKTSLAVVIANTTESHFTTINAVLAGVKEIRRAIDEAQKRRKFHGTRTILFVDEVHRWNKAQQDALLPWVENGTIILIGATIENPYFEVNRALLSRSRIFQLTPLTKDNLLMVAKQALKNRERGYGRFRIAIADDALHHLVNVANGDARSLLNALELAVETTPEKFPPAPETTIKIDLAVAEESIQRRVVLYDKEGDYHFDTISAFIKSLRGSDPDATLYWLAKMVYAGEDPRYMFRRMLIFASEDVGMADPNALVETEAAAAAFDRVGMPEGRFHLAHAALYLATAPKSNSILAFFDALSTVENEQEEDIPAHLKDGSRDSEAFGHGEGYLYPHSFREHWVAQQYLPTGLQGKIFYHPGSIGYEQTLREAVEMRREASLALMFESEVSSTEILTFNPSGKSRDKWMSRAGGSISKYLADLRARLFQGLSIQRYSVSLDINAGSGFLTWELMRRSPEGGVFSLSREVDPSFTGLIEQLPHLEKPHLLIGDLSDLDDLLKADGYGELRFDFIVGRNALFNKQEKGHILELLFKALKDGGTLALAEANPRGGQRLSDLIDLGRFSEELAAGFKEIEVRLYSDSSNPAVNWQISNFESMLKKTGFSEIGVDEEKSVLDRLVRAQDLQKWFCDSELGRQLNSALNADQIERIVSVYRSELENKSVQWNRSLLLIRARKPLGKNAGAS